MCRRTTRPGPLRSRAQPDFLSTGQQGRQEVSNPERANAEAVRLHEADADGVPWRTWGPYVSERQWGTVREDYSPGGDAWAYFPHDQARSRAYRWGEDGLAGFSDDKQRICI